MESPLNTTLGARLSAYLVTAKDFQRQRQRVNKRISKLRHELNIVTKDTKNYKAKEKTSGITQEQYDEDDRFGLVILLLAERDMLYALEIKSMLEIKSTSHATLLKTKMKRALTHADKLIKLSSSPSSSSPSSSQSDGNDNSKKRLRKQVEIYIFAALIAGQLSITTKQWLKALNAFSIAKCCLDYLYTEDSDKESYIKTLCTELIETSVDPSINLASSQLKISGDLKTLSRKYCHEQCFPQLSPVLGLIGEKYTKDIASSMQLQKEVDWRGHTAEIYNDEVAFKIQELTNDKKWLKYNDANQFDGVIASWISILDLHKRDTEKNQDDDDLEQKQSRAILLTYLNYNLLFTKLKRDLLLIGLLAGKAENRKDIVRLFNGIIQIVKELEDLPGVYNDEDLHYSLEHLEQYYEYKKNVVIAEAYQLSSRFAEALKIFDYVNKSLNFTPGEQYFKVDFPFDVSKNTEVAFFKVDLEKRILQCQINAQFEQTKEAACTKYTLENLSKYPAGLNALNVRTIEPILCKPVLFDIAYNYISYTKQPVTSVGNSAKQVQQEQQQQKQQQTENTDASSKKSGFFGIFRG